MAFRGGRATGRMRCALRVRDEREKLMTRTHIGRLKVELEKAAEILSSFEDFRSPLHQGVVAAVWLARKDGEVIKVAVREDHGTFYRGRIANASADGNWVILADDGDLIPSVPASMFASIRLELP
jgi:hypothetical protein